MHRGIHLIPRLRVRNENVHLRLKPTRIIQCAGQNSDGLRLLFKFAAGNERSAFRTKTALVFSSADAGRKMVAQLSARQSKRFCGHHHCGSKSAASQSLAIATVTFEHHGRLSGAFITNCAAGAATGKWNLQESFRVNLEFQLRRVSRAASAIPASPGSTLQSESQRARLPAQCSAPFRMKLVSA